MRKEVIIAVVVWLLLAPGLVEAQNLSTELEEVRALKERLQTLLQDLPVRVKTLEGEIESLSAERTAWEAEREERRVEIEELKDKIRTLEQEKGASAATGEKIEVLENAKRGLEADLEAREEELQKLRAGAESLESELSSARGELERSSTDKENLKGLLEQKIMEVGEVRDEIGRLTDQKMVLEESLREEKTRLSTAADRIEELLQSIKEQEKKVSDQIEEFSLTAILDSPRLINLMERSGRAPEVLKVLLDDSVRESYFILNASGLSLSLIGPGGNPIEPGKTNYAEFNLSGHKVFRVVDPSPGEWEVRVEDKSESEGAKGDSSFTFLALGDTDLRIEVGRSRGVPLRNWYPKGAGFSFDVSPLGEEGEIETIAFSLTVEENNGKNAILTELKASGGDSGLYQFSLSAEALPAGEYLFIIRAEGSTVSGSKYSREIKRIVWINDITTSDLLILGREAFLDENWDEAIIMAEYAVVLDPKNVQARRDLGFYYSRKASTAIGLSLYEREILDHRAHLNRIEAQKLTVEKGW